jgi:hypothetical protein
MIESLTFGQVAAAIFCGNILTLGVFYSLRALWDVQEGQPVPKVPAFAFLLCLGLVLSQLITALP